MHNTLRKFIRGVLLESKKYLYHASPRHDIEKFDPRPFIHTPDFTESGAWVSDDPPPPGWKLSKLVFASDESAIPLYSLPRDTPRLVVDAGEPGAVEVLRSVLPDKKFRRGTVLFLPSSERSKIDSHTWTEYAFDPVDFTPLPGDVEEYVSTKSVKPVFKRRLSDPIRYIESRGISVEYVDDVAELADRLTAEGIQFDSEALG